MQILSSQYQYNLEPSTKQPDLSISQGQLSDPSFVFGLLIAIAIHGWTSWKLPIKAGYEGKVKQIWFWLLFFPGTSLLALLVFCLLPYPTERQRANVRPSQKEMSIDEELERLKRRNNL